MFPPDFLREFEEATMVSPEVFADNILKDLGLTWEDLKGKKILEIGNPLSLTKGN